MKKLVNHNGIAQYKYIVSTQQELFDYIQEVASKRIANRVSAYIKNPEDDPQMEQLYRIKRVGVIQLGGVLVAELWEGSSRVLRNSKKPLVFNESGGYTYWNDGDMKVLDWKFLLPLEDVIVLENGNILEKDVALYLKENNIQKYLFLDLIGKTKEEIFYYCSKASKIVFQTQAIDTEQLESLLTLATKLEPKTIVVVNSPEFPLDRLTKHNVVVIEEKYD